MREPSLIQKEYTLKASDFEDSVGRYNKLKRLVNARGEHYIESPVKFTIPETAADVFFQVDKGHENRLDLISYEYYNTPLFWWALAVINHIDNPFDVPAGIVLRIPPIKSIYASGVVLV